MFCGWTSFPSWKEGVWEYIEAEVERASVFLLLSAESLEQEEENARCVIRCETAMGI